MGGEYVSHADLVAILKERDSSRSLSAKAIAASISKDVTEKITAVLTNGLTSRVLGIESLLNLKLFPAIEELSTGQGKMAEEIADLRGTVEARPCIHPTSGQEPNGPCPILTPDQPLETGTLTRTERRREILADLAAWPTWIVPAIIAIAFAAGLGVKSLWPIVSKLF